MIVRISAESPQGDPGDKCRDKLHYTESQNIVLAGPGELSSACKGGRLLKKCMNHLLAF